MRTGAKSGTGRWWTTASAGLLAAVLLFLLIGSFHAARKGQEQAPYLSFSADKDGIKAVRTLLHRKGADVDEWRHPWIRLPEGGGHTLLAVEPRGVDPKEKAALEEWLKRGNRAVWIGAQVDLEMEGLETVQAADPPSQAGAAAVKRHAAGGAGGMGDGTALEAAAVLAPLRLKQTEQAVPLLSDGQGLLAARYPVGQGSLTVLLAPEWLRNDTVLDRQHFELVWPVLLDALPAKGGLWFDEYHHGYHAKPGILAVYPDWLVAVCIQAALAVLLMLWRLGKRFGPIETPREWTVRRGDETVLAVAGWHRKNKLRRAAIEQQEHYLRQLFQERWGVRVTAEAGELLEAARVRAGEAAVRRLKEVLDRLEQVRQPGRYPDRVFLEDCERIAEWTDLLEGEKEKK